MKRKGPQEDAVDETENRSRRAHANAERQYGDDCEAWPPHQRSYAEAHILTKRVEPRTDPHITDAFLDLVDTTDLHSGCPASLVPRHALRNFFVNQQVDIAVDLVGEFRSTRPRRRRLRMKWRKTVHMLSKDGIMSPPQAARHGQSPRRCVPNSPFRL